MTAAKLEEISMAWYHGKLNRVAAEHVLSLHGLRDGLFLVRESSSVAGDFVLTLSFEGEAYHFQVRAFVPSCGWRGMMYFLGVGACEMAAAGAVMASLPLGRSLTRETTASPSMTALSFEG